MSFAERKLEGRGMLGTLGAQEPVYIGKKVVRPAFNALNLRGQKDTLIGSFTHTEF